MSNFTQQWDNLVEQWSEFGLTPTLKPSKTSQIEIMTNSGKVVATLNVDHQYKNISTIILDDDLEDVALDTLEFLFNYQIHRNFEKLKNSELFILKSHKYYAHQFNDVEEPPCINVEVIHQKYNQKYALGGIEFEIKPDGVTIISSQSCEDDIEHDIIQDYFELLK